MEISAMLFSKESHGYVYKWTELSTWKWYIGSRSAKNCHTDDGYVCSSKIVKPLIQNNPENWVREILWIGERNYATLVESEYLTYHNAASNEMSYNQHNSDYKWNNTGRTMPQTPEHIIKRTSKRIGSTVSDDSKRKMSESAKGKIISAEARANMSKAQYGRKHSEDTKNKIRSKSLLRRHSDETKQLISEKHKGRPSTRKGTTCSIVSKEKMSISQKNKKKGTCIHCGVVMDICNLKKYHNDNCRLINPDIIRNQHNKGMIVSNETRIKQSEKAKNRIKLICEHCNKSINKSAYTRYHGINCKHK